MSDMRVNTDAASVKFAAINANKNAFKLLGLFACIQYLQAQL